ncbi:MAG: serine/threonine-protein kinase [Candidatus Eremiobacteraeota bacterium]|nr:serine/threonine-protein kinase [Candidatus Eremiobacteraeota bacterium]
MAEALPTGTVFRARYRITAVIGEGATGRVYQAEDLTIAGARWALKELSTDALSPEEGREAREFFQREFRILSGLNHTGLPKVVDCFPESSRHYLVMEYIEGENLEEKLSLREGSFSAEELMPWIFQIMDILEYLHSQSPPLIYRDLKPSNIVITAGGKAKLIDFGITRAFDPGKMRDTQAIGTPGFSAPEQYGTRQTDGRSDIYSLGATTFRLLSGENPQKFNFQFPPLLQVRSGLDPRLSLAVGKALEKEPERRFQSIAEMRAFLRKEEEGGSKAPQAPSAKKWQPLVLLTDEPWTLFLYLMTIVFCAVIPVVGSFICIAGFAGLAVLVLASLPAACFHMAKGEWRKAVNSLGVIAASLVLLLIPVFLLSPSLKGTGDRTMLDGCRENLKTIAAAIEVYSHENSGSSPPRLDALTPAYLQKIPSCPAAGKDTYRGSYTSAGADKYTFYCRGSSHGKLLSQPDYPRYSRKEGLVVDPSDL